MITTKDTGRENKADVSSGDAPKIIRLSDLRSGGARSYDAAAITRHTENHFLYATGEDADSFIRQDLATLRNRARYEIRNNSYAKGMVETKANDLVGTGPRLQVLSDDPDFNSKVEDLFTDWCQRCDIEGRMTFNEIVRLVGSLQQDESGEGIIIFENRKKQDYWFRSKADVALRLRVVEPDRMETPFIPITDKIRDGIEYDEDGRPAAYYIMAQHPGATLTSYRGMFDYDRVPAEHVIHLYRQDRPGQSRGVPWITPGIPLFAQLRRYTLATVSAAETAANISGVLETETGTAFTGENSSEIEAMDEVEIARNAMLTLPANSKMNQFKPEQPSSTYKEFKRELINEIARCLNMPFNVAAANSSEYNYASGRLDWQVYFRMIRTVRAWIVEHLLDRVFFTWLREAQLITAMRLPPIDSDRLMTQWFWPGSEHVDPMKEAGAQNLRLRSFNTNLAAEHAAQGRDWEREVRQWGKEVELLKGLGLYELYVAMLTTSVAPVVIGEGEQEEEETTKEKTNAKSE